MSSIDALSQHLVPATLVVARVGGVAIHGPILSSPAIPLRIKGLLVAALGLAVYPSVASTATMPHEISLGAALPLLVIDMVISSLLVSMGMMMLPPVLVSLPFKLLLFVLVDGWTLVAGSLLTGVMAPLGGG
jgi:flagellar biosynthesis protein FliR